MRITQNLKPYKWQLLKALVLGLLLGYTVIAQGQSCEKKEYTEQGNVITQEGAWCWFADPRALHHQSKDGTIDKTYIGYIDIHGNIKAMQYDFRSGKQQEVLVRSCFQPDDHDSPTFLILPDERIMIFYSRHTDESCFYYRISQLPGDITTLGEEHTIPTKDNTTYPSPFILSDDPEHFYLCWRGIHWHPTIARLTIPDKQDKVVITDGPCQLVQSTGARPYAKYQSNGKDRIYVAYTTGHPDNEDPNWTYLNYIDIHELTLHDVTGKQLSRISKGPFNINKTTSFAEAYPQTVANQSRHRDWIWQLVLDKDGAPVIAMTDISQDKKSHNYYRLRWENDHWEKHHIAFAGGHFHQSPDIELCYSAGFAIDPADVNKLYTSIPVEGAHGRVYEIHQFILSDEGEILSEKSITRNSLHNNERPYIIPGSEHSPLRLVWMHGSYYDWIVSEERPLAFNTAIHSDFAGLATATNPDKEMTIHLSDADAKGVLYQNKRFQYRIDRKSLKPEIVYKKRVYRSTNALATTDSWNQKPRETDGKWHELVPLDTFTLRIEQNDTLIRTYINGLVDQTILLHKK